MKDMVKSINRQVIDWKEIFTKDIFDKELLSEIYKELLKLNHDRRNNPIKKMDKDMNRHPNKEDIWMENKLL